MLLREVAETLCSGGETVVEELFSFVEILYVSSLFTVSCVVVL
ncbi:hypothetical protein HMPREF9071_2280 [Capnocytophaga sp. oral taxon 338 str. F0234]|nr:hypothetical protein HMPREF9071_2280 [Capnocytophaga sp. oral taxon 338 str. F0234]